MKKYKGNKVLQRVLESRQLGLKLIANVTYGYTAANFSGRMPCSEVSVINNFYLVSKVLLNNCPLFARNNSVTLF